MTKKNPFPGNNEQQQLDLIFKVCGTPTPEDLPEIKSSTYQFKKYPISVTKLYKDVFPADALDLLSKMLTVNPKKRIKVTDALNHAFFLNEPLPCIPAELPKYPSIHEYEAKRKRQETDRFNKRVKVDQSYAVVNPKNGKYLHDSLPGRAIIEVPIGNNIIPPEPTEIIPPVPIKEITSEPHKRRISDQFEDKNDKSDKNSGKPPEKKLEIKPPSAEKERRLSSDSYSDKRLDDKRGSDIRRTENGRREDNNKRRSPEIDDLKKNEDRAEKRTERISSDDIRSDTKLNNDKKSDEKVDSYDRKDDRKYEDRRNDDKRRDDKREYNKRTSNELKRSGEEHKRIDDKRDSYDRRDDRKYEERKKSDDNKRSSDDKRDSFDRKMDERRYDDRRPDTDRRDERRSSYDEEFRVDFKPSDLRDLSLRDTKIEELPPSPTQSRKEYHRREKIRDSRDDYKDSPIRRDYRRNEYEYRSRRSPDYRSSRRSLDRRDKHKDYRERDRKY